MNASALADNADVLAGESAGKDVDGLEGGWLHIPQRRGPHLAAHAADVGVTGDIGPVLGKDALAIAVLLAEPHSSHTGSFEAEVESSDAAEERSDRERFADT